MKDTHMDISTAPVYVFMGVSGTGKTTIANAISQTYECVFLEGDDFHPKENIDIMSAGRALTDENRLPWLRELSSVAAAQRQKGCVLITCSSLKLIYRNEIRKHIPDASFIHLQGSFDYIEKQMSQREGHFMPVSLLQSQFDSLEPLQDSERGITISIENGIKTVLAELETFMAGTIVSLKRKPA